MYHVFTPEPPPRPLADHTLCDKADPCSDAGMQAMAQSAMIDQLKAYATGQTAQLSEAGKAAIERICQQGVVCRIKQNKVAIIVGGTLAASIIGYAGYRLGNYITKR